MGKLPGGGGLELSSPMWYITPSNKNKAFLILTLRKKWWEGDPCYFSDFFFSSMVNSILCDLYCPVMKMVGYLHIFFNSHCSPVAWKKCVRYVYEWEKHLLLVFKCKQINKQTSIQASKQTRDCVYWKKCQIVSFTNYYSKESSQVSKCQL